MSDNIYLGIVYGAYFCSMVILSFLINGLLLKFVSTLGIRNSKETVIRWSPTAKPSLGGLSFYLVFLFSVASYSIFFEQTRAIFNNNMLGILASCTVGFLLGLSDDAYNTRPLLKLIIQILCSFILIATGTHISLFHHDIVDNCLTVIWVVGLMNAVNLLDNMDGITALVSGTIILSALSVLYINSDGRNINIILLIGVLSALIGFLFFNWHPSKMFMGDTGSQFLGIFLATMGIIYFWNTPDAHKHLVQSKQFFVTILAFAIPIIDTTSVVINRIRNGRSPFVGGKDHTTHSFFYMGLSEKQIAILYTLIGLLSMFFIFLIVQVIDNWGYLHIVLFSVYFILLFWFMYAPTRKYIHYK